MKKIKLKIWAVMMAVALSWAVPLAPVMLLVGCSGGCAALDKGADPVVVRAEQFYRGADKLFRAFTTFEERNRAYLSTISTDIEKAANTVRTDGFDALVKVQEAVQTYKANRTPDNKANIDTWIAVAEKSEKYAHDYFTNLKLK